MLTRFDKLKQVTSYKTPPYSLIIKKGAIKMINLKKQPFANLTKKEFPKGKKVNINLKKHNKTN